MIFKKNVLPVLICLLLTFNLFAAVKKDKYVIDPTVHNFDSFPSFSNSNRYYVSSVENLVAGQDSGLIGYTRTGVKTKAPIISTPLLEESFRNSVFNMFTSKNSISLDASTANYLMRVKIVNFSIQEKNSFLTQTINAKIKLEVTLIDPLDSNRVRRFMVDSENSQSALDTSNYAESITRDIFSTALMEIWKTINK